LIPPRVPRNVNSTASFFGVTSVAQ
jgi:hypothetical protein